MNNTRRKAIGKLIDRIAEVKELIDQIEADTEDINTEEEEAKDNLPESLQEGEKGEAMQAAMDALYEGIEFLQSASGYMDDAIEKLDEARQ